MGVKKAEDLVYIYTNSKLLRERRGADPVIWYDNQPFSEDSDLDVGPVHVEEDNNDGGDEGLADEHEGGDGDARDGGVDVDDDDTDDSAWEFHMDNVGGGMPHNEPGNQPIGIFDWLDFDEEPPVRTNHVVNDMQNEGMVGYNRADDDIDDKDGINEHCSDDGGNNDDFHSIDSDSNNDNGGGNDGGVQIPNEEEVENGDEVDQPRKAFEQNLKKQLSPEDQMKPLQEMKVQRVLRLG